MKKYIKVVACSLLASFFVTSSYAQLDKSEAKEWKNRAKAYKKDPESLKNLVEEHQQFQSQITRLEADNNNLQSRLSDKDSKIQEMQDDMA